LLSFTWWVNRKDAEGHNVFAGGFLGLDNIGPLDRSAPIPDGGHLDQSDGTAWMGMFCLDMLAIALELALEDPVYADLATKFFEHFLYIGAAIGDMGGRGVSLWDEEDGFFYDVLCQPDGRTERLKVRSLVGLIPLLAVEVLEAETLARLPDFARRLDWFLEHRPDLAAQVASWTAPGVGERRLLALVHGERLRRILARMLDPNEFLSDHGIRSLSAWHRDHPFVLPLDGVDHVVDYEPGESTTSLFGGNSNWRGPVWFPIDFLLIEALQRYAHYYGDGFTVAYPTGSGPQVGLEAVAADLSRRLIGLFRVGPDGRRPAHGDEPRYAAGGPWADELLFFEYFHADTGRGLGASHQTGWTALVAKLIEQTGGR
ncbi:MAG: MGH1-like glycoside hydrolase domain-containing protein, partial [Candidatus Limnocylindrales bacterium]